MRRKLANGRTNCRRSGSFTGNALRTDPFLHRLNGTLQIIGLSLDSSEEAAKRFAKRHELKWVQGFLGEWTSTEIPERYGVSAIPALYLIGRDGRLIAKGFELRPIREELERVLATEKGSP